MNSQVVPAGSPPPGVSSNFANPLNYGPNLIACNVVLLVISIFVVIARMVSRTVLTDWRLGWDDYTIIMALIGTSIFTSFVITTTEYGLGKHIWDVEMGSYSPHYLWWIMATFAACPASYFFVKLSILFFYLRVFQLQAKLRYIIYALFAYCTIYYLVAFAAVIGLCNVKNRTWDITVTMNCFAYGGLISSIGAFDLVADVLILAFPVPMVLKLRISWPQRVYLLVVFLAGITASIACAIRIALGVQARGTTDATMAQYHVVTLFCIEHYLALIGACLPTLGPFFRWLRPSHWKHGNSDRPTYEDAEAFQRAWPKTHKTSNDDSIMNDSLSLTAPAGTELNSIYGMHSQSLPGQTQGNLEPGWMTSNVYGDQKNQELKNVMEVQQSEEDPKQTFRNSMELGCLRSKK